MADRALASRCQRKTNPKLYLRERTKRTEPVWYDGFRSRMGKDPRMRRTGVQDCEGLAVYLRVLWGLLAAKSN